MYRAAFRVAFFLTLLVIIGSVNSYVINGPLLQSNTELGMNQFKGVPATAGDFKIGDFWVSLNSVYIIEVIVLALIAFLLFFKPVMSVFYPPEENNQG
jgi:hypothetical protein